METSRVSLDFCGSVIFSSTLLQFATAQPLLVEIKSYLG